MSGTDLKPAPLGNDRAVTHGCYSAAAYEPRALELATLLRPCVPKFQPAHEVQLVNYCRTLARIELAEADIAEHGILRKGKPAPILADLNRWQLLSLRQATALGLTPTSQAALGVDVAKENMLRRRDYSVFTDEELEAIISGLNRKRSNGATDAEVAP